MLSRKTKYGLKALLYLAKTNQEKTVLISELAEKEKIPQKFLESILLELKNRGILQSRKGKGGGYKLAKSPKEINFGQIVRALDGPLAPVSCVSQTAYKQCDECLEERCCGIRLVMKDVRDAMAKILDHTTLEDAIKRVQTTPEHLPNYTI